MGKFSNSLGVWDLELGEVKLELRPKMKDVREFRGVLMNEKSRDNKSLLFNSFIDYMWKLIEKEYPEDAQVTNPDGDNELKLWLELNVNVLFEEAMVAFKWTSREELEKNKQSQLAELKKKISNN